MNAILLQSCAEAVKILKCGCDNEAVTNPNDVWIVVSICVAIVLVALITAFSVLAWKNKEIQANNDERQFKKTQEENESERKQKSDLLDKYLDFLKEQTKEKDYVTMEEYEKQRKEFMNQLLELLKDEKFVCLNPSGKNNTNTSNTVTSKDSIDNKQTETDKSPNDKKKTAEEEKKDAVQYLIDVLNKYINSKKSEPANIDQTKINQYKKTLEHLIQLSQQGKLDEFTIENLNKLLTPEKLNP